MAYVGTPIDTRNTFQSLQGKRFNGDGSTTAFTLDVAPSSTLDIEVFVGNVRQDPNSAYTLSGTTLTFTGAPPSGTNNIYVVHQAKSVGTIDLPEGALVDLNGGSDKLVLDADGDTTISADTDDQIDFKVANADQIKLTDGVLAPSTDNDIDLGTSSLEFKDAYFDGTVTSDGGTFDTLGVGLAKDLGVGLHIKTADCGGGTPGGGRDNLIIEDSGSTGITIIGGASNDIGIAFGDSGNASIGMINYNNSSNYMQFNANDAERMRIDSSGNVIIGGTSPDLSGANRKFAVQGGDEYTAGFRGQNSSKEVVVIHNQTTGSSDRYMIEFKTGGGGGSGVGSIRSNSSSTAFNTSSDYRLKENEVAISDGITRLKQLKPYKFNFKIEPDKTVDGFFAHEVSSIVPEAISGTKDATETYTDDNGDEQTRIIPQQIDQAKLVPLLTSALQEAITEIESLKARVTTLEG